MVKDKDLDAVVQQLDAHLHNESRLGQYLASIGTGMSVAEGPATPCIYLYMNRRRLPADCTKELKELTENGYKGYMVKHRLVGRILPARTQ